MPPPPINLKNIKYTSSFLLKNFFSFENFGANFSLIMSLKYKPAKKYSTAATIVVEISTNNKEDYRKATSSAEEAIRFLENKGLVYGERGKYFNLAIPHNSNL